MEGVQKWELRERDIRLLYFVVGSSILLEFFLYVVHYGSDTLSSYYRCGSL